MQKHKKSVSMVYANLKAEMVRRDIALETLATHLQISTQMLQEKIYCIQEFTISEVKHILEFFPDCNYDYLFNRG
jgi:hypothetical protein